MGVRKLSPRSYAFGTKFDPEGNLYAALGLSNSYHSRAGSAGVAKITPDGKTIPIARRIEKPGGIGPNEHGALFYIESHVGTPPSLKFLKEVIQGTRLASTGTSTKNLKGPPNPESGGLIVTEKMKVKELVPYAAIFPYIRMGRLISGFQWSTGRREIRPFENQIFLGDYTQSIVMRHTTEKVNESGRGRYPSAKGFPRGFSTFSLPRRQPSSGGTNRGWPVRGRKAFALERIDWTGRMPLKSSK